MDTTFFAHCDEIRWCKWYSPMWLLTSLLLLDTQMTCCWKLVLPTWSSYWYLTNILDKQWTNWAKPSKLFYQQYKFRFYNTITALETIRQPSYYSAIDQSCQQRELKATNWQYAIYFDSNDDFQKGCWIVWDHCHLRYFILKSFWRTVEPL